jgi:MFS family permease
VGISAIAPTVTMTAIANWFHRRVGLAIGIAMTGWGVGGFLMPLIVNSVDDLGWRSTMVWFAIIIWAVAIPASLLVRHRPQQYGQLPDGDTAPRVASHPAATMAGAADDLTFRQAIRHRVFWHLALILVAQEILVMATLTHIMPYLSSIGVTRALGGIFTLLLALFSVGGRLVFGWLGDRIDQRKVMFYCFMLIGGGMLTFSLAGILTTLPMNLWLVVFVIAFGLGYGGIYTMRGSAVYGYFGQRHFGVISGALTSLMLLGNFLGAPLVGWIFDTTGEYKLAWLGGIGVAVIALVTVVTMPRLVRGLRKPPSEPIG